MSDIMNDTRISIRLDNSLHDSLSNFATANNLSQAKVVRDALAAYLQQQPKQKTSYDLAMELGIIGCAKGLPADLSTNKKKYMEGFGES